MSHLRWLESDIEGAQTNQFVSKSMKRSPSLHSQPATAAAEPMPWGQQGDLDRADLVKGTNRILEILRNTDSKIEGVEVNIFRPWGTKEWKGLQQTARAGVTDRTHTSAMEISSSHLMDAAELEMPAHVAVAAFKAIDETINGLTLSIYKRDAQGSLKRQSVAVERAWLPPEPPSKEVSAIAHEQRSLVNDPLGLGTGVSFPS